jgi:hypothetical protein
MVGADIPPSGVPKIRSVKAPEKLPKQAKVDSETEIRGNGCRKKRIAAAENNGRSRIRKGA